MGNKQLPENVDRCKEYGLLSFYHNTPESKMNLTLKILKRESIWPRDISLSRLKNGSLLQKIFEMLDLTSLKELAFTYCENICDLKFPKTVENVRKLSLLGSKNTKEEFLENFVSVEELDLRGTYFHKIPEKVFEFEQLTKLNVEAVGLTEIPAGVSKLVNLKNFNFSENFVTQFPDISKMTNLSVVFCFLNKLTALPDVFPASLKQIDFSKNEIKAIPVISKQCPEMVEVSGFGNQIAQIEKETFENLMDLTRINLMNNRLSGTFSIEGSRSLVILDLTCNKIDRINGLSDLVKLEGLNVAGNNFDEKIFVDLKGCERIARLCLGFNNLRSMDGVENLKRLWFFDVSGNQITKLPVKELIDLKDLDFFYFSDNPGIAEAPVELIHSLKYCGCWGTQVNGEKLIVEYDEFYQVKQKELAENAVKGQRKKPKCRIEFETNTVYEDNKVTTEEEPKDGDGHEEEKHERIQVKGYEIDHFDIKGPYRPSQEDATCIEMINDEFLFIGVFDGHGGSQTSQLSGKELPKYLRKHFENMTTKKELNEVKVKSIINLALEDLTKQLQIQNIKDGSCLIGCLFVHDLVYVINIGDSRCICYGEKNGIHELSVDHKPWEEVTRLEQNGDVVINSKVNGFIGCSRSLGDFEFKLSCKPVITVTEIEQFEYLILACDGVWDVVENENVVEIVLKDEKNTAKRLINYALSFGSRDNISAVVVRKVQEIVVGED